MRISGLIFILIVPLLAQRSDIRLEHGRLDAFLKSRGASELGADVAWKVPAKAVSSADESLKGALGFRHRGILLVIGKENPGLAEVQRRGGKALIRGTVVEVPGKESEPKRYAILVREISRRR